MRLPTGSRLLRDVAQPLSGGYAAGGSLYYAESIPVRQHTGEVYEMSRVDPVSGRALAGRRFPSSLDDTLLADGSLWVTTSAGDRTSLWRLDPRTLAVRSRLNLPSARPSEGIAGSLAVAGGHLWAGAGSLDRVSLRTGRVNRVVSPPYPGPVQVAADRSGRILMASLGYEHPTYIARLNPVTGETVAHTTISHSLGQPTFGGIIDGGAWIENNDGSRTTAWRVDVNTLRLTRLGLGRTDRVAVRVNDGILWVTEPFGRRSNLSYCADPYTGRPLVRLPPLPGDSVLLAADSSELYFTDVPVNAHAVRLEAAPVSRRCTA